MTTYNDYQITMFSLLDQERNLWMLRNKDNAIPWIVLITKYSEIIEQHKLYYWTDSIKTFFDLMQINKRVSDAA
jgi:hypothetical protein